MTKTSNAAAITGASKALLAVSALATAVALYAWLTHLSGLIGPAVILALATLASAFHGVPALNTFVFTFWVFTMVAAALFYPAVFLQVRHFNQTSLIVTLPYRSRG